MTKQMAANTSVLLALVLWPAAFFGAGWALGDAAPYESAAQARFVKVIGAGVMMSLTVTFLAAAAWLAGYSYAEAPKRAVISTVSCTAFVLALTAFFLKDAL
jgi:hypothetical protein